MKPIPFLTPRLPEPTLVARDYAEIFEAGVFTNNGPFDRRFAEDLSRRIGSGTAVTVTANATTSIQLASRTLFHPNREFVLVASFTAPAGPLALRWSGYEPLLIDIEASSWQPDVEMAEAALESGSDHIAGILLTNTFGTANSSIERWEHLAERFGMALVIDSAPGFGSRYPWGEVLGARGTCEIFSFHATKTLAIGEGGAIASRDHGLIDEFDHLKNFGFDQERRSHGLGLNAKLPELSSAMGLRQLEQFALRTDKRREVLGWYLADLKPMGLDFQDGVELSTPPFLSVALPRAVQREAVGCALTRAQIGWRAYFNRPIHLQPAFAGARKASELPQTQALAERIISLPLDDDLSRGDVTRVTEVVGKALSE